MTEGASASEVDGHFLPAGGSTDNWFFTLAGAEDDGPLNLNYHYTEAPGSGGRTARIAIGNLGYGTHDDYSDSTMWPTSTIISGGKPGSGEVDVQWNATQTPLGAPFPVSPASEFEADDDQLFGDTIPRLVASVASYPGYDHLRVDNFIVV